MKQFVSLGFSWLALMKNFGANIIIREILIKNKCDFWQFFKNVIQNTNMNMNMNNMRTLMWYYNMR